MSTGEHMRIPEEMTLAMHEVAPGASVAGQPLGPGARALHQVLSAPPGRHRRRPAQVPASLTWKPPVEGEGPATGAAKVCGKVVEVLFDCHGEFEGFVLDECCEPHLRRELASGAWASSSCAPAARTSRCASASARTAAASRG